MVIRNTSPSRPPPSSPTTTPTPTPATTPADLNGTTSVDADLDTAGVTDIERLAGQSLADGMSLERPDVLSRVTSAATGSAKTTATTAAKTSEPGAVTALIEGAVGKLQPGETVRIGGKVEAGDELVAEVGVGLEITRRDDGAYDVKVTREGEVGLGGKRERSADGVEFKAAAKLTVGGSNEVTFKAATLDDAVKLGAEVVGAAVVGGAIVAGASDIAVKGVIMFESDQVTSTKWAISSAVALEIEGTFDPTLKAAIEASGKVSHGVVFMAPDSYFLELEAEGTFEAGAALGTDALSVAAPGLGVEGKATIRIPLKGFDPLQGMGALVEQARANVNRATVTVEGTLTSESLAGDVPVVATKTVQVDKFASLFTDKGWDVQATIDVGPRISPSIGVAEAEVVAQRTVILYEHKGGSLEAEAAAIAARKDELTKKADKVDPTRLKRP